MSSSKFRILFFTFFSCGFLGAAVLAGLALWPLWLRHQAVTRLVEEVEKPAKDWPRFWSTDKKWLKEFEEPFGRVKDLRGEEWAARRLARIVEDCKSDDRKSIVPRCRAIALLSELGPDAHVALRALEQALQQQADDIRGFAAIALGNMGEKATPAFSSLLSALRAEQEDDSVRRAIVHALRRIDPNAATDALAFRPILQEINAAPSVLGWGDCNPAALVRVVNHLRSLGKADAIVALREYAELAYMGGALGRDSDATGIDSSDQQRISLIVPLLFTRTDPEEKLPEYRNDRVLLTSDGWRGFYITLEDDLPFHDAAIGGRSGPPDPSMMYLVDWAREHGSLRTAPLRPPDNPLDAADRVMEKLSERERAERRGNQSDGYLDSLKTHIRRQARQTVIHLFPSPRSVARRSNWLNDADWSALKLEASHLGIHWDEDRQQYAATDNAEVSR